MTEHSEHWVNSKWMSNIKYWLLGSFLSFSAGWVVMIVAWMLEGWGYYITCSNIVIGCIFILFGPFIGALIIKLIKKDMPWYFYITTGLIYGTTLGYFCVDVRVLVSNMSSHNYDINALYNIIINLHKQELIHNLPDMSWDVIMWIGILCLASFVGGFIVDVHKYFTGYNMDTKRRNTIIIIELSIILCVITTIIILWRYNYYTPYCIKGDIYYNKNESKCPQCGNHVILSLGQSDPYDWPGDTRYLCKKCRWEWTCAGWDCPKCGNIHLRSNGGKLSCLSCGWSYEKGVEEKCLNCGHIIKYRRPLDDPPTVPDKICPNCGIYYKN